MAKRFSESQLRADLQRLLSYTNRIRTYSVDNGLDRIPAIAKTLGLKVSLGIWLGSDFAKNAAEVEKALKVIAAFPDVIDRVYVGNEAVVRGDLKPAQVIAHLKHVKSVLARTNPGLQAATAEPWYIWEKNPELAEAGDFIGAHLFSFWDGVPVQDASTMAEATRMAFEMAEAGDAVLLSPACASFDEFHNFEHRGDVFRAWVQGGGA
jgi:exo-beta-1,3-glucanase (GH17 family)